MKYIKNTFHDFENAFFESRIDVVSGAFLPVAFVLEVESVNIECNIESMFQCVCSSLEDPTNVLWQRIRLWDLWRYFICVENGRDSNFLIKFVVFYNTLVNFLILIELGLLLACSKFFFVELILNNTG